VITTTKKSSAQTNKTIDEINKPNLPYIDFLYKDGNLKQDNYSLSPQNYFVSENDNLCYGKIEIYPSTNEVDSRTFYYLKQFRGGRPGEYLPDPYGLLSTPYDLSTNNDRRGERFCEYVRVRKDLFDSYQEYLKTRNPRIFRYVEKSLLDNDGRM